MPDPGLVERARELVRHLSRKPRFAGSAEESEARTFCAKELERAGLQAVERPFEYSQWPGEWGIPTAAAVQLATILIVSRMAIMRGSLSALITGAALFAGLLAVSADARRRWVQRLPFLRASAVNLEARRGTPSVWLVAHLDSKSQTVPMLLRIASSVALGVMTLVAGLLLLASVSHVLDARWIWPAVDVVAAIVALPSLFCLMRNQSTGALDNATGVATVLLAAAALTDLPSLGVLITSGEELGLAGARVWAPGPIEQSIVLNCDTVDDRGDWRVMYSGREPHRITVPARTIWNAPSVRLSVGRMIPGILADSMAFADRGIEAVTLSRGTISTLARLHTRRDNSNALSGSGVAEASALLAALTRKLS